MIRIAILIFAIISITLVGIAIIAVLVAGYGTLRPIVYAAIAGAVISVPVTWGVAKKIAAFRD